MIMKTFRSRCILSIAIGLFLLLGAAAAPAGAAVFWLKASAFDKTMPDGTVVPMWGFGQCTASFATCSGPTVPGPELVVPPDDTTLTINLWNDLPATPGVGEPISLMIPGQRTNGPPAPTYNADGRVFSFDKVIPVGAQGAFSWTALKPGTYLYQSAAHVGIQVQMGLYGAVLKDSSAGNAYQNVPYQKSATFLFSDVDPSLHQAVASGNYGPGRAVTSPMGYHPRYFLINGEGFSYARSAVTVGLPGEAVLLRILNAGVEDYTPLLQGLYMTVVAEDGQLYPYAKEQYELSLSAGKTFDALITSASARYVPLYDRRLHLTNWKMSPGGMFVYLKIADPVQHILTVQKAGTGAGKVEASGMPSGILCGTDCAEGYNAGTQVSLKATPELGSVFAGWEGGATGTSPVTVVTMDAAKTVTARFNSSGPAISVTSPVTGDAWERGTTRTISWTYTGNPGQYVRIELWRGASKFTTLNWRVPVGSGGSGTYSWRVGNFTPTGTNYTIKVVSTSNPAYTGTSGVFTIGSPATITVTSPTSGARWRSPSSQTIRWNYTGTPGTQVKIQLLRGGSVLSDIADNISIGSAGTGSYGWVISSSLSGGSNYQVKVMSKSNPTIFGLSSMFTITK